MGRWLESVGWGEAAAGGLHRAVKESLKSRCRSAARAGCKARTPGGWHTGDWVWSGGERGWGKAQMGIGRGWGESGCGDRWSAGSFETTLPRTDITTPKLQLSSSLICGSRWGLTLRNDPPLFWLVSSDYLWCKWLICMAKAIDSNGVNGYK